MDIISAILDIDNKANEMLKQGKEKRDEIIAEAESVEKNMQSDIDNAANSKILAFEKEQEEAYLKVKSELDNSSQQAQANLNKTFDENLSSWEDSITASIIG